MTPEAQSEGLEKQARELLAEIAGGAIHIPVRDYLEKRLAALFGRQPDMSGDQRKRLNSSERRAAEAEADFILRVLTAALSQAQRPASEDEVERVALALVNVDQRKFDLPELTSVEEFRFDSDREEYLAAARAAIAALQSTAVVSETEQRIATLFDAIKHGDDAHRGWLKEAIDNHFAGLAVPPPRSGAQPQSGQPQ